VLLEHDPPRASPTDTVHAVHRADDGAVVVHVTSFNRLMWDNGSAPTTVIEHGVDVPEIEPTLELDKGLVVVNDLATRGRRLGADVVARVREHVPVDIVGMRSEAVGGLGEVPPPELPSFMARYRFFFHPVRYTSLGLAVCEAMSVGLPVVGLATTELVTVIDDGVTGYISTDPDRLVERMRLLLDRRDQARRMGTAARAVARRRFAIERFAQDWCSLLHEVAAGGVRAAAGS
jgi:glycosyltransferase involved in cell wall biosynthesis